MDTVDRHATGEDAPDVVSENYYRYQAWLSRREIIQAMAIALACMDDLMFLSKIMEATKALAIPLRSVKTVEKLVTACRESPEAMVFLDLDDQRLDAIAIARALRSAEPKVTPTIYAFVSHVNEGRIQAAGEGLFDQIYSRGQFVRVLPELLGAPSPPLRQAD